ncbi:MAG: hypothetical protein M3297_16760 [Thermoproteota archaeon]|nr:hypothetical protein [Thermoproteota archaeon]
MKILLIEFMIRTAVGIVIVAVILSSIPLIAFAQAGAHSEIGMNKSDGGKVEAVNPISRITEDIGIFAIGVSLGLLILPLINKRNSNIMTSKNIFISIAALTITAGIIHILLVKEHMEESYVWGLGFILMGVSQLMYGVAFVVFANSLETLFKRSVVRSFYSIGIIGNLLLVAIFIYVRLFVPPFSPEAIPVNEIEVNGILTVVIEVFIVGLLVYLVKREKVEEKTIINMQTER